MSEVKEDIATQLSPMSDPPFYAGLPVNIVVLASDYAALQAKADALKASNEALAKALERSLFSLGVARDIGLKSDSLSTSTLHTWTNAMESGDQALAAHRAKDAGEKPL